MKQCGFTVWFTGLSGAGKTTLATMLKQELLNLDLNAELLDGDVIRKTLCKDLGFSREDRIRNLERVACVAELLNKNGVTALCSIISPYREAREYCRSQITNYIEVYVKCPLEVLVRRDSKGLYQQAAAGTLKNFTGISDPYEEPLQPEITLETNTKTPAECLEEIMLWLKNNNYISSGPETYSAGEEKILEKRLEALGYL